MAVVAPWALQQLTGSGGTGAYRFEVEAGGGAGGAVDPSLGGYAAGAGPGVDRVRLTDAGCAGEAWAEITVPGPLEVRPARATVPPGTAVTVVWSGGTGAAGCALQQDASGASLEGCQYVAGAVAGVDVVRVRDPGIGAEIDVWIEVAAVAFRVPGQGRAWVPVGAAWSPAATAGSGELSAEVLEGPFTASGGEITATGAGEGRAVLRDRYAELSVEVRLTGLAALGPAPGRDGERSMEGAALALGDVDGDGWQDAALGSIEPSVAHDYGGVVAIYAGGPDGLAAEPARVFAGGSVMETLGRGVASADLDNDGLAELIIGADRTDYAGINTGAIHIYRGEAGRFFSDQPWRSLYGQVEYERLGSAVAACDFDGDGWVDLAAGAIDGEDDAVAIPATEQGGVHVFRGAPDGSGAGFDDKASFILYGVAPDGAGGWAAQPGMHLGQRLAAADLDGDGRCDLAAGAPEGGPGGPGGSGADQSGIVLLYRGEAEDGLLLSRAPVAAILPEEGGERLGWRVAAGDVDGDGAAELAVSAPWFDGDLSGGGTDGGEVRVWSGLDLSGARPEVSADSALWRLRGDDSTDYLGMGVAFMDGDGDGRAELLAGAFRADAAGGLNEGYVYGFTGSQVSAGGTVYAPEAEAAWVAHGAARDGRFGQAVAGLPGGQLLVLAGYDDSYGVDAGAPWSVDLWGGGGMRLLGWPGEAAGHDVGRAIGWLDTDGDGREDLLIGAPDAGDAAEGGNAGEVYALRAGEPGGGAGESVDLGAPEALPVGYTGYSSSDRFGYALTGEADFDGDGWPDLAVAARRESRPDAFDASHANAGECPGGADYSGAVWVFRGGPGGVAASPSFVWYPAPGEGGEDANVYALAGGADHDGDGYGDLIAGSWDWGGGGGAAILYGRPADPGGVTVICDAILLAGEEDFDRAGWAVAGAGDLDGDGCGEFVVGATGEEFSDDWYNQGSVRVLWGWGGAGCAAGPEVTALGLRIPGAGAGSALDAGYDVDGDGIGDLLVGASTARAELSDYGAAWLVPGWWLLAQPREAMPGGALPPASPDRLSPLLPEDGISARYGLAGATAAGMFGAAVALVPDPEIPGRGAVAVGSPQGAAPGAVGPGGGVEIYRWGEGGLDPLPWGIVVGEASPGMLGEVLAERGGALAVGAPQSSANGLEIGAVYLLEIAP